MGMMPLSVYLQQHEAAKHQPRFYLLSVQPNLFGGWALRRAWGRVGSPGQVKIDRHASQEEAESARGKRVREQQRRGYAQADRLSEVDMSDAGMHESSM
jgi:predicted DNA-binding WGR domain protein